jgi:WD40 repeat protein
MAKSNKVACRRSLHVPYNNGILNGIFSHGNDSRRKHGLKRDEILSQSNRRDRASFKLSGLPTPPQEDRDEEMDRVSNAGGSRSQRMNTGLSPPGRDMPRYVQDEEIIFSSASSDSEDDDEGPRNKPNMPLPENKSRVPYEEPRETGPLHLSQPGNESLKRMADGRMKTSLNSEEHARGKGQEMEKEKSRKPSRRVSTRQDLQDLDEDDANAEELLQKFLGKEEANGRLERHVEHRGADDLVPLALQSTARPSLHLNLQTGQNLQNSILSTSTSTTTPIPQRSFHQNQSRTITSAAASTSGSEDLDFLSSSSVSRPRLAPSLRRSQATSTPHNHLPPNFSRRPKSSSTDSQRAVGRPPSIERLRDRRSAIPSTKPSLGVFLPPQDSRPKKPPKEAQLSLLEQRSRDRLPHTKTLKSNRRDHFNLLRSPAATFLQREIGTQIRPKMAAQTIQTDAYAALRTVASWRGASGDVIVVDWSSDGLQYAAGASTAMDTSNPQYNKRNNLLAGDVGLNSLRELSEHYIGEPRHDRQYSTENPSPIYTTVTDVKWDIEGFHLYSSSYDETVKRWDMTAPTGPELVETFWHDNRVEVMALSSIEDNGLLATGTNHSNVKTTTPISLFHVYDEVEEGFGSPVTHLTCAGGFRGYVPTVLGWGNTNATKNLLVAGFSGQAPNNRDDPVPQGLLCLWEVSNDRGAVQKDMKPATSNVFDAVWHPNEPLLAVASPVLPTLAAKYGVGTRSLIRMHDPRVVNHVFEYECPALDINTVSFAAKDSYKISASCTNGVTYVWDHRKIDQILCKLTHGNPLYPTGQIETRELHDTGVRLALWGARSECFYTGSSDGVIKQWDVKRAPEDTLVCDVESFGAEIMSGKFSPDFSNLVVGDALGGIHILSASLNNSAEEDSMPIDINYEPDFLCPVNSTQLAEVNLSARPAAAAALDLVRNGEITIDPVFGPGKGPNYKGPYAAWAHEDSDIHKGLIPEIKALQLDDRVSFSMEEILEPEFVRNKRANQGLARARNARMHSGGVEGENLEGESAEGGAGSSGPSWVWDVAMVEIESDVDMEDDGVDGGWAEVKDENEVLRDPPVSVPARNGPPPAGRRQPRRIPGTGHNIIDLTELSD